MYGCLLKRGVSTATTNARVVLAGRATGNPLASNFSFEPEASVPELRDGTCLVKNRFVSVDPAMKGWISTAVNYASVPTGDTMTAFGVGEVVASRLEGVETGDLVSGRTGWQNYGIADPAEPLFRKISSGRAGIPVGHPLSTALGVLGINGLTAFFGLNRVGRPEPGQTVLCSTASGATGSAVGQLAARQGCRTVGLAGGSAKAALCVEEFRYEDAIDYKALPSDGARGAAMTAALKTKCPDGIDVYFDMVGGDTLDCVLPLLNVGARVVVVGTAATASWIPPPLGLRMERTLLVKRAFLQGFLVFDWASEFPAALAQLGGLVETGDLRYREDVRVDLASAPQALEDLYTGANTGKMIVKL